VPADVVGRAVVVRARVGGLRLFIGSFGHAPGWGIPKATHRILNIKLITFLFPTNFLH
jgi:hypothetical protein